MEPSQPVHIKPLNSLLSIKMNEDKDCFQVHQSKKVLAAGKQKTLVYMKEFIHILTECVQASVHRTCSSSFTGQVLSI